MKLSNIKTENFKTLRSFELPDPQKVNVIVGKNGAGKSSVLEAIRFVLTGEAPASPVTSGETQGSVSADFLGVTVQRNCGKKTTVRLNGKATTQKSVAEMMTSALGCTMDSLKIATSANMLSAMSAGALSDYLISNKLIPAEIDFDCLLTLCAMSPEAEKELAMMLPAAPVKFDMDAVDEAYDHFFAARTVLKSRIKEAELTAKFEGDSIPKPVSFFHPFLHFPRRSQIPRSPLDHSIPTRPIIHPLTPIPLRTELAELNGTDDQTFIPLFVQTGSDQCPAESGAEGRIITVQFLVIDRAICHDRSLDLS